MLVIRRKQGESLLIGTDVEIRIVELSSSRVVLGVEAPGSIPILRKEISVAAEQNQAAAKPITATIAANLAARLRHSSGS